MSISETLIPVVKLSKDLKKAAATLGLDEARYLVDQYYALQERRIASANQGRALTETDEPHDVLTWFGENASTLEGQILRALGAFAESQPTGRWLLSQYGIGPVLAAGYLAHVSVGEVTKRATKKNPDPGTVNINTVGKLWRFAGLDPTSKWEKGQKRPWNASLKRLCWLTGKSFEKFKAQEDCFYGKLLLERIAYETARNESGGYAGEAQKALARGVKWRAEIKEIYESGKLPPSHINARARRWTVKLFLSHLFEVAWHFKVGTTPPKPFVLAHLDHVDYIPVPNDPREDIANVAGSI